MSITIDFSSGKLVTPDEKSVVRLFLEKYYSNYKSDKKMLKDGDLSYKVRAFHRDFMFDSNRIYMLNAIPGAHYPNFTIDIMEKYINDEISSEQILYYSGDILCWDSTNMEQISEDARIYQLKDAMLRKNLEDVFEFYNKKIDIEFSDRIEEIRKEKVKNSFNFCLLDIDRRPKTPYVRIRSTRRKTKRLH